MSPHVRLVTVSTVAPQTPRETELLSQPGGNRLIFSSINV